jgi:hypothetical protein
VGHPNSSLGRAADRTLVNFTADGTSSESFYIQTRLIVLSVLRSRNELGNLSDHATLFAGMGAAIASQRLRLRPEKAAAVEDSLTSARSAYPAEGRLRHRAVRLSCFLRTLP